MFHLKVLQVTFARQLCRQRFGGLHLLPFCQNRESESFDTCCSKAGGSCHSGPEEVSECLRGTRRLDHDRLRAVPCCRTYKRFIIFIFMQHNVPLWSTPLEKKKWPCNLVSRTIQLEKRVFSEMGSQLFSRDLTEKQSVTEPAVLYVMARVWWQSRPLEKKASFVEVAVAPISGLTSSPRRMHVTNEK